MGAEAFQRRSQQECSPHLSGEPTWDRLWKRGDRSQREERGAPTPTHALAEEEKCFDAVLGESPARLRTELSSGMQAGFKEDWRWKGGPADQSLEGRGWPATTTLHETVAPWFYWRRFTNKCSILELGSRGTPAVPVQPVQYDLIPSARVILSSKRK